MKLSPGSLAEWYEIVLFWYILVIMSLLSFCEFMLVQKGGWKQW